MRRAALSNSRAPQDAFNQLRPLACRGPVTALRGKVAVCTRATASTSVTSVHTTPLLPEVSSASAPDAHTDAFPFELTCPICQVTSFSVGRTGRRQQQALHCERCERTFSASEGASQYVDLTPLSGFEGRVYKESNWGGTTLFQTPLVSYIYERGWRQNFVWFGFPGEEREFQMAMDHLQPAFGEVLVDMSCGSGLFARRFAASGCFKGVIASDFSAGMLDQTSGFIAQNAAVDPAGVLLLRADITRLPFPTGSVAAIHAGAAIHCWPNPTIAMAEVARVLRPGGVFVGTTVMKVGAGLGEVLGDDVVRPLANLDPLGAVSYRPWEEGELRELGAAVGLTNFWRFRTRRFIMFRMERPGRGAGHEA